MKPNDPTRRTVLKSLGAAGAGALALSGTVSARSDCFERELAAVRSATASYSNPENAVANDFVHVLEDDTVVPLPDVVDDGFAVCGMGFHFVNADRVGSTDPTAPTVLAYGVDDDENLILGAVEWIVPKEMGYEDGPPDIFDHDDGAEAGGWEEDSPFPDVWSLHAWVHTHNPDGVLNPTNPRTQFHPDGCHSH